MPHRTKTRRIVLNFPSSMSPELALVLMQRGLDPMKYTAFHLHPCDVPRGDGKGVVPGCAFTPAPRNDGAVISVHGFMPDAAVRFLEGGSALLDTEGQPVPPSLRSEVIGDPSAVPIVVLTMIVRNDMLETGPQAPLRHAPELPNSFAEVVEMHEPEEGHSSTEEGRSDTAPVIPLPQPEDENVLLPAST